MSKKELIEEIKQLADETSSILELPEKLSSLFEKYGIKLHFKEFPSTFNPCLSNSNSSPIGYPSNWSGTDKSKPRGYPGWYGRVSGTIDCQDNTIDLKKNSTFGDISHDILRYILRTGTGSSGENFNIGCDVWLYNFKKLTQNYNRSNERVEGITIEFNSTLTGIINEYERKQKVAINKDKRGKQLDNLIYKANDITGKLKYLKNKNIEIVQANFSKENPIDIPFPPSPFDQEGGIGKKLNGLRGSFNVISSADITKESNRLFDIVQEMEELIKECPELFI